MYESLKRQLNRIARLLGYQISPVDHDRYFSFQALINFCLNSRSNITFVQIGGCDGTSFDPIHQHVVANPERFQGIILEPVKDYYHELKNAYRRFPQIQPVQYAIHNELDQATLYRPNIKNLKQLPGYAKEMASFDKSHLHKFNTPDDQIVEELVPCISLGEVVDMYDIQNPDLLILDIEGYDSEILLNINFNQIKPSVIRFEHGAPDGIMQKDDLINICKLLHKEGYEIAFEHDDVTAYLREMIIDGETRKKAGVTDVPKN